MTTIGSIQNDLYSTQPHAWQTQLWARLVRRIGRHWVISRHVKRHCQPFTVEGRDAINGVKGPALIIANHSSHFDTPVALSALEFMRDFYGVPAEKLELYPLGGFVPDNSEYAALRKRGRAELGVSSDQILIVQSGKIDATKKLIEALEAFTAIADPALCFMVPGLVQPDVEARINALVASDPRIHLLGWKSPDELRMILAAADVYCQPGTQSATMQMSIANRCAILLDDIPGHRLYLDGNGWLVGQNRTLADAFAEISSGKGALAAMAERSHQVALRMLDYRLLAARLYEHR